MDSYQLDADPDRPCEKNRSGPELKSLKNIFLNQIFQICQNDTYEVGIRSTSLILTNGTYQRLCDPVPVHHDQLVVAARLVAHALLVHVPVQLNRGV